jgi:hypothetical protein
MTHYIKKIEIIINKKLIGSIFTFENIESQFIMNKAAQKEEIDKSVKYFNNKLPKEYKYFLEQYNGGVLFKIDDFAGFKLLNSNELIVHNEFQKTNFGLDWNENIILFCECIGDAEYLGFKLNENGTSNIIYCILDLYPNEWKNLDLNFSNFINKLIEEKGKKYWLNL